MAIYADARCILDTDLLISLETGDGCNEHDGLYVIRAMFALGQKWREAVYTYTDKEERDTAFRAISETVKNEQEALELELAEDDEDGDDEQW